MSRLTKMEEVYAQDNGLFVGCTVTTKSGEIMSPCTHLLRQDKQYPWLLLDSCEECPYYTKVHWERFWEKVCPD